MIHEGLERVHLLGFFLSFGFFFFFAAPGHFPVEIRGYTPELGIMDFEA